MFNIKYDVFRVTCIILLIAGLSVALGPRPNVNGPNWTFMLGVYYLFGTPVVSLWLLIRVFKNYRRSKTREIQFDLIFTGLAFINWIARLVAIVLPH